VRFIEGSYGSLLLTEDVGSDSINFGHEGRARTLSGCGLGVKVREDILEKYALEIIPLGQG
jgi:L-Ala-D/L-Glu epimerase / N-acetyl-D-glutamate racemase